MIDFAKIDALIADGYIKVQHHPSVDLRIYNYSVKCQYDWFWNSETKACRGLIVDGSNRVVARPFEKFFSYEQLDKKIPNEPFEVFEKLDGSLGILYFIGDDGFIATRGSFVSDQAVKASAIFREKYSEVVFSRENTYLFEIIYPENRIVVNYGDIEDLFLLAVLDTETGKDIFEYPSGVPRVKRYDGMKDFAEILEIQRGNEEGFVILFESGQRVKLKFEEYKRLHKLLTGINARSIWDILRSDGDIGELVELVPDEYFEWVQGTVQELKIKYKAIEAQAKADFKELETRKETAMYFKTCENPGILFAMLDGKDHSEYIWKLIKPRGDTFFRVDTDAT